MSIKTEADVEALLKSEAKVEAFLKSFPPGYRFKPRDEELVVYYLKQKLFNKPLPPNIIREVQLYQYNPETLIGEYRSYGEGEWYFFTPRSKKYKNGSRPSRAAGDGYWKATGADRTLVHEGAEVGYRKALVFYRGKPTKGVKTDWMMHEFRLKDPPPISNATRDDMRLDDWVLCKVYRKTDKSMKTPNGGEEAASSEKQELDSAMVPQQGLVPFNFGSQLGELDGLPTSSMSYYDHDAFLESNPTFFLDDVSDYYDHNSMPMTVEALPSSLPPFPSVDKLDQFTNINHVQDKFSSVSQNFGSSSQFQYP